LVINKTSYDTFLTTGLDQTLRSIGAQSVFVAGLLTDVCVSATARACADRGYQTVVVGDASTTVSDVLHESALTTFSFAFGRVLTTDQVAGLFAPATTAVHAG
jgi:nicotinamidase-related amidase